MTKKKPEVLKLLNFLLPASYFMLQPKAYAGLIL
jgi:hypothetical protein